MTRRASRPSLPRLVLMVSCTWLASCGGSSGSTPPPTRTIILAADQADDGWVSSSGSSSATTCGFTGDLDPAANGVGNRQFLSFFLNVGPTTEIVSALLAFYVSDIVGPGHGDLVLDHLDFGTQLDAVDYVLAPLTSNIGAPRDLIGTNLPDAFWYLDVTTYVRADRAAGRNRSQFRARFQDQDSNADNQADFVRIVLDGCPTERAPVLIADIRTP